MYIKFLLFIIMEVIIFLTIRAIFKYIHIVDESKEIEYFNEDDENNKDLEEIKKIINEYKKK